MGDVFKGRVYVFELASGQTVRVKATDSRAAWVNLRNEAGTEIGTVANPIQVTGSGAGPDPVGLKNIAAATINPATEDTLATLLLEATFTARINTQGQKLMAASTPVVLPSDQSAIPASQSGTWNIDTLTSITNDVEVVQPTASDLKAQVEGTGASGSALGNPVTIAGTNFIGGTRHVPTVFTAFGINTTTVLQIGANAGLYNIDTTTGGGYASGDVAHDSPDIGTRPLGIGAECFEYEPTAVGERGRAEVSASADRVKYAANRRGEFIVCAKPQREDLTALNNVFDTASESVTSAVFDVWQYANGMATLAGEISKSGSPTRIDFIIECSNDGTNYQPYINHGLGDLTETNASIGTGGKDFHITFPINCYKIRFTATSTGTDGSNTITLANMTAFFGK